MDGTDWKIKKDNGNYKMPIEYEKEPALFSLKIHHAGKFKYVEDKRKYVNGLVAYVDWCDIDKFFVLELRALDVLGLGSTVVIEELPSSTPHVTPPPTKRLLLEYHKPSSTPHVTPPPTTSVTQSQSPNATPTTSVTQSQSPNATPSTSKRKFTKNSANRLKSAVNDIEPMPLHTNVDTNENVDCIMQELMSMNYDFDPFEDNMTASLNAQQPSSTPHVTPPPTTSVTQSQSPNATPTTSVTQSQSPNDTPSTSKRMFTKNSANRLKSAVNDIEPMPLHTNVDTNETVDCIMQELMSMNYDFDPFEDNMTASLNAQPSVNEQERTRVVNNEPEETLVEGEIVVEDEEDSGTEEDDSDSEDDEDYFFDEETYLEEVNVDMADYHFNIDVDVEWVRHSESEQEQVNDPNPGKIDVIDNDNFESGTDSENDGIDKIRRKKLKEIKKANESRAKSDILLNNLCECFNGKILDARDAPIITALEYIREYLMRRMVNVIVVIKKTDGPLTPSATKLLKIAMDRANNYTVWWNRGEEYEVKGQHGNQCVVNVVNKVCSCRKWELTGIPCAHAIAANYNMALNGIQVGIPEEWVHKCYWLATWKHTYSYTLGCLNGRVMWKKSQIPTTLTPPKHNTPVGRPRKNRIKTKEENAQMVKDGNMSRAYKTVT
ncbi:reverse transcriptase domain-containing protein [Tanacetum coccineum]